ncbi:GTP cyclohydrolase FolE2 [Verrucomicrobia bacterium]|nr:GTP cyclohydrolase FolE2 [Verrucomicrobiota bacterium]
MGETATDNTTKEGLEDTQAQADQRGVHIDKVGVRGMRFPIQIIRGDNTNLGTVATIGLFVDLPKEVRGTHMSRFVEIMKDQTNDFSAETVATILKQLQEKLQAHTAHLEIDFPYFITKKAPISGIESPMDYKVRFRASAIGDEIDIITSVVAQVTTLCPCSKAISAHGAHNQRGEVTLQTKSSSAVTLEELIRVMEKSASAELYALLKRPDEKAVTEQAYENPVFVEDLVRNVAVRLREIPQITWYQVEAENYESIHSHNAYACVKSG